MASPPEPLAYLSGLLYLVQRRPGGRDREEQLRIVVTAGGDITPGRVAGHPGLRIMERSFDVPGYGDLTPSWSSAPAPESVR